MNSYQLSIITPQGKIFEGTVSALVAPGKEGSFGVLARHAPMIASLQKGPLKVRQEQGEKRFEIGPGILEINHKQDVLVLSDTASEIKIT